MHRHVAIWVVSLSLVSLVAGCGGGSWSFNLVGTSRAPGAEGTLQVEAIEGGNRMVTATLQHLPPPDRLGQGNTIYTLWFRDAQGHSTKASNLEFDPGSRTARATATTPMTTFIAIVTVERNGARAEPSENVIYTQRVVAE